MTRITTDLERSGDEARKIAGVVLPDGVGDKAYYIGVLNMGTTSGPGGYRVIGLPGSPAGRSGSVRAPVCYQVLVLEFVDDCGAYATGPNAAAGAGSDDTPGPQPGTGRSPNAEARAATARSRCGRVNSTRGTEPPTAPLESPYDGLYFWPAPR